MLWRAPTRRRLLVRRTRCGLYRPNPTGRARCPHVQAAPVPSHAFLGQVPFLGPAAALQRRRGSSYLNGVPRQQLSDEGLSRTFFVHRNDLKRVANPCPIDYTDYRPHHRQGTSVRRHLGDRMTGNRAKIRIRGKKSLVEVRRRSAKTLGFSANWRALGPFGQMYGPHMLKSPPPL